MPDFSLLSAPEVLKNLNTSSSGLTSKDVASRQKKFGKNTLLNQDRFGWVKGVLGPFLNPFAVILLIAAGLSFVTGSPQDSFIIIIVLVLNALIEYVQRFSSHNVLKSLRRYNEVKVVTVRSGNNHIVSAEELVPGDIVNISSGEKIPADGRLIATNGLMLVESALTGESLPIAKQIEPLKSEKKVYQKNNMVFKGSYVSEGEGVFVVTAIGSQTQFGQIAALTVSSIEATPIAKKISKLIQLLIIVSLFSGIIVFSIGYLQGKNLLELMRFCIALVVSIIPEGLPLTLTVVMLAGISAMAKHKVLVRRISAIETLGMVTAIATDKTGTLTQDKLTISEIWQNPYLTKREFGEQLWLSVGRHGADHQYSIENQILDYTKKQSVSLAGWKQIEYLPFVQKKRWSSITWEKRNTKARFIKGAPESVLSECRMGNGMRKQVQAEIDRMANSGMRVVAVAGNKKSLNNLQFIGLVGFSDKLRLSAKPAVRAAKAAGIEVYMLTGDNAQTAKSIAQQVGIAVGHEQPLDGSWAAKQPADILADGLRKTHIFGRVLPEFKYKILEALKLDHITAMTGDGVNDAPALVKADVGIAMGSGTDVAKDAADIILLDNNFAVIVEAIAQGRRIYSNIRKMLIYILCSNFSQTIVIIVTIVLGMPIPFTAVMILINNLLTDTPMILSLGVEEAHGDQMQYPPRGAHAPLLGKADYIRVAYQSFVMASIVFIIYSIVLRISDESTARVVSFFSLVAVQWSNAFNARSHRSIIFENHRQNRFLWATVSLGAVLSLLLVLTPLGGYLQIVSLDSGLLIIPWVAGLINIIFAELYKIAVRIVNNRIKLAQSR